jgi:hypothetical protein
LSLWSEKNCFQAFAFKWVNLYRLQLGVERASTEAAKMAFALKLATVGGCTFYP